MDRITGSDRQDAIPIPRLAPWLTAEQCIELARSLGCEVRELDAVMEARRKYDAWLRDRIEYVGGARNL